MYYLSERIKERNTPFYHFMHKMVCFSSELDVRIIRPSRRSSRISEVRQWRASGMFSTNLAG